MRRALVASPSGGARLARILRETGWDALEVAPTDLWRTLAQRPADLVLAQLPWTGWKPFVQEGRRMARRRPGLRLLFLTEVLPPGLNAEVLDGLPATPVVRLSSSPRVLQQSIAAAA